MLFDSVNEDSKPVAAQAHRALALASPVTISLIAVNVLIFLAMLFSGVPFLKPAAQQVLPWGADFGPLTQHGQWWRLLTACFLHFGIVHLAVNMFVLFQIGFFAEILFRKLRYLLIYLFAGIGGNIAGLYFHPFRVGAGASGAIFGLYGAVLGLLLMQRGIVPAQNARKIATSAILFILYNLIYGLTSAETDIVAHIGGLLTGFVLGCVLAQPLTVAPGRQRSIRTAAVAAGAILLAAVAFALLPGSSPAKTQWYLQTMSGPNVTIGASDRVVYSGEATAADAERVGQIMLRLALLGKPNVTVLLTRDAGGSSISIPLHGDETLSPTFDNVSSKLVEGKTIITHSTQKRPPLPWDNPELIEDLRMFGPPIAAAAGKLPLTIRLLNATGDLRREIRIDSAGLLVGTSDIVSYSGQATAQDASALGQALQSSRYFQGHGAFVALFKDSHLVQVSFLVKENAWDDPRVVAGMKFFSHKIAPAIGGPPLKVRLIDHSLQTRKEFEID